MAPNPAMQSAATATITAQDLVPVVPSDAVDLPISARYLRCKPLSGGGGTLRVTTAAGQVRNTEIAAGGVLMLEVARVHETGTTATGLEAAL